MINNGKILNKFDKIDYYTNLIILGLIKNNWLIESKVNKKKSVVFMLWGNYASEKGKNINPNKHLVLKSSHPSPFSAQQGFFGNKHFSKCNIFLESKGIKPIDWKI